ncbi:MAG TPA: pilin [Candidatus Moranbacteria bacterium]|nr:pilin [Candidatus Moranbacteria bacterium]
MNKLKNKKLFFVVVFIGFMLSFYGGAGHDGNFLKQVLVDKAYAADDATSTESWGDSGSTTGTTGSFGNIDSTKTVSATDNTVKETTDNSSKKSSSSDSTSFTNPLSYTTVEDLLTNVLSAIQKIVVVLALVVLVIGAIMYIVSTGESEMLERAKKAITAAIMGMVIAIAAPSILKELSTILGWTDSTSTTSSALTISEIAVNVLNFLLGVAGVLAIIMMVIGGIMYLTSTGDEERIKKGKSIFTYSVIGIIIVLASLVIVRQIAQFFVSS